MAASKKVIESSNRLRYVRALERFHKSITSYFLSGAELSFEVYTKKIDAALKVFSRVESVDLYKGDLKELETLIKKMIEYRESELDIQEIKEGVMQASNHLDKSKNSKKYKKDKHANSKYDDWN